MQGSNRAKRPLSRLVQFIRDQIFGILIGAAIAIVIGIAFADPEAIRRDAIACAATDYGTRYWNKLRPRKPANLRILVARLEFDDTGAATRAVTESLRKTTGLSVHELCRSLGTVPSQEILQGSNRAQEIAERLLSDWDADVLVWGERSPELKSLRLHLQAPRGPSKFELYHLTPELLLPEVFRSNLDSVLAAYVIAAANPLTRPDARFVFGTLASLARKLQALWENAPTSSEDRAAILTSYRETLYILATKSGDTMWAEEALALEQSLGNEAPPVLLSLIGSQSASLSNLQRAVSIRRRQLASYSQKREPIKWALSNAALGIALEMLGSREAKTQTGNLEEAVKHYYAALRVLTLDGTPYDWASTHVNLGNALKELGARRGDTNLLEEAVTSLQTAMEVFTEAGDPFGWSTAKNSLGTTLAELGKRETEVARLKEAVSIYQDALRVRSRESMPRMWAATQVNLGVALRLIGERENSIRSLSEAVETLTLALSELPRDATPVDWAYAECQLSIALRALGEREHNDELLRASVTTFNQASTVRSCDFD